MQSVSAIITLILGLSFFIINREKKLFIIVWGSICCDIFQFANFSFATFKSFSYLCFFISELKYISYYIREIKQTPIFKIILTICFGAVVVISTSKNINNFNTLFGFITIDLIAKYVVVVYAFVALKNYTVFTKLEKVIFPCILFITVIGFINFILKTPIWINIFSPKINHVFSDDRFRVLSTFTYCFDYGQTNFMLLLMTLYGKSKRLITNFKFKLSIACCLFGIIFCGCRTVLASSLIGFTVYMLFNYTTAKVVKYYLAGLSCFILSYCFIPQVQEKTEFLLSAIDPDSKVSGSSSSMRLEQYATVFMLIKDKPFIGNGHNYFLRDLGWDKGEGAIATKYSKLAGLEGAIMSILLERGFIGVFVYSFFYIGLICFALKMRKKARSECATAIAILISFIAYGNMTGELNSASLTLLLSGFLLKLAYLKNNTNYNIAYRLSNRYNPIIINQTS